MQALFRLQAAKHPTLTKEENGQRQSKRTDSGPVALEGG